MLHCLLRKRQPGKVPATCLPTLQLPSGIIRRTQSNGVAQIRQQTRSDERALSQASIIALRRRRAGSLQGIAENGGVLGAAYDVLANLKVRHPLDSLVNRLKFGSNDLPRPFSTI